MTREQFLCGYLVLTAQPWGKAYRTMAMSDGGEPSPAEIQLEFYYHAFTAYDVDSWRSTCETFAAGDHWPSIDALKLSMKHDRPRTTSLPAPHSDYVSMHEALADHPETLAKLKKMMQSS